MRNKISVVISSYNRAHHLIDTLPTLICQPIPKEDYEIVIVDDRSTDNTREVCMSFADQCNIRYIRLDEDMRGPIIDPELAHHVEIKGEFDGTDFEYRNCSYPKNVGWKSAKHDIIMFTDPEVFHLTDTMIDHLHLQNATLYNNLQPKYRMGNIAGYVYGKNDGPGRPIEKAFYDEFLKLSPVNGMRSKFDTLALCKKHDLRLIHEAYPFCITLERGTLEDVNGWDARFIHWGMEDNDAMQRLAWAHNCGVSFAEIDHDLSKESKMWKPRYVHLWHDQMRINNHTYNRLLCERWLHLYARIWNNCKPLLPDCKRFLKANHRRVLTVEEERQLTENEARFKETGEWEEHTQ